MIMDLNPFEVEPLESAATIFTSPIVYTKACGVDRYGRKPNGSQDQGRKDEND